MSACAPAGIPAASGGGKTRITFWSALRGSKQVVEAFNRSQNRIQVVFQQIPTGDQGGYAKLSNAARAGNAPDVATLEYPQLPGFAIDGVTRDLTSLLSDGVRKQLQPQALGLTTFQNRLYSVPFDVEPMVMHYRKDLFAQYGLTVPRTWDEFEALARTVRDKAPGRRLALFPSNGAMQFAAFAWQAGAQWFDTRSGAWNVSLADAETRRVAAYWQQLIDDELVFVNALGQQSDAQTAQGLLLVRLSGAWDAGSQMTAQPAQKGKWAIAPLPQWDLSKPAVGTHGGSTFTVTQDSAHPEAAMEFIEWQVSSPDAMRARLSSGTSTTFPVVPALVEAARTAFKRDYYGGQDIYGLFRAEAAKIRDGWTWGPRMSATQRVMQDGFARMSAGEGSILDAVRGAQSGTMPDLAALGLSTSEHSS
jgi:multiple sugar transport system substrate-binding protein